MSKKKIPLGGISHYETVIKQTPSQSHLLELAQRMEDIGFDKNGKLLPHRRIV